MSSQKAKPCLGPHPGPLPKGEGARTDERMRHYSSLQPFKLKPRSTNLGAFRHNSIMSQLNEGLVLDALRQIRDPDLHKDIVKLGFIKDLKIAGGAVSFRIVLTTPACPVREEMACSARELVSAIPGVDAVNVTMDAEVPKGRGLADKVSVTGVKNIVAVSTGKGGVGRSTVA